MDLHLTGSVIPAHPLALTEDGAFDIRCQMALTKYYLSAGATGLAVGVHTTQFDLHNDPSLLKDVWQLSADVSAAAGLQPTLVAGVVGDAEQALAEATTARDLGYHAVLLSAWGMADSGEVAQLERAKQVAEVLPVIGFYPQRAVGGRLLSGDFWRQLFDIENVVAVKIAPFDRYRTRTVMDALLQHDRWNEVVVLTGNDDTIVADLVTEHRWGDRAVRATGGLLGQWAVGTRAATEVVKRATDAVASGVIPADLLSVGADLVDINAAVFDVDNDFAGCIAGVNEVLKQQGLLSSSRCLPPDQLSGGQSERIALLRARFPDLFDETFVSENRDRWLS